MTRVQRIEAIGVVALALAGMLSSAAAALGLVSVTPPEVVVGLAGLLITKAAVAAAGMLAFAGRAR